MRISEFEIETIKSLAKLHFGSNAEVFLFGSRTNNQLRGGDIDLFIRNPKGELLKIKTKIDFINELILQNGKKKIYVVLENLAIKNSSFLKTIYQTYIQVCLQKILIKNLNKRLYFCIFTHK